MFSTGVTAYRAAADIERLEQLIARLPNGQRVRLTLQDGTVVTGLVSARPMLQLVQLAEGREGSNALLRLQGTGSADPDGIRDIWLDSIRYVEELPDAWGALRH